jgi:tRNA(Ile)-lysidine synthase
MADTRRAIREWAQSRDNHSDGLYLVALSGGGDSLALAWGAALELPKLGLEVGAVIVDHQLQADSADVAARAARIAEGWGLSPVLTKVVQVGSGEGPEDAARQARYGAFSEALKETGAAGILLAHTEDDQAETVLLGLARGSGPGSLKGMAKTDGVYHRPLLGLRRDALRDTLTDAGESWWEDPHNSDPRFSRVRVRTEILPLMESALGPGITEALARSAELFRNDSAVLDDLAQKLFVSASSEHTPGHWSVPVAGLAEQPEALRSRVIRLLVISAGAPSPSHQHIREVSALITAWKGQSEVSVAGARVGREGTVIHARIVS